jgi:hypothetical protein
MVNLTNLHLWTQELRTTTRQQVNGVLGKIVAVNPDGEPVVGNCCLGVGTELAGATPEFPESFDDDRDEYVPAGEGDYGYYEGEHEFPPSAFFDWLGIDGYGQDLQIDWPIGDEAYLRRDSDDLVTISPQMQWTASGLNDEVKLTFSQIADVVDYFGVRNG